MATECMDADKQRVEHSRRNAALLPAVWRGRLTLCSLSDFSAQQHMGPWRFFLREGGFGKEIAL